MNHRNPWAIIQKQIFWLIILCIPLFLINIRDNHDWGGDFAQYLAQAENIANGFPHWQSNYIFNPDAAVYGPAAYPPGFPLLLSPIIKIFGPDFKALMIWQSLFLAAFAISSFLLLKRTFSNTLALIMVLLIVYHPWVLQFKAEIMSDIAFSFFLIFILFLYVKRSNHRFYHILFLSLLIAFLPFIRTIGLVFLLAIVLAGLRYFYLFYIKKKKDYRQQKNFHLQLLLLTSGFYIIIKYILFPTPLADSESYALLFNLSNLLETVSKNISYYFSILINHFSLTSNQWLFVSVLIQSFFISFFVLGFFLKCIKDFRFTELLFLLYMGVLIIYPYRGSGFRFLLPVFPIIILYVIHGVKHLRSGIRVKTSYLVSIAGVFILLLYINGINSIIKQQQSIVEGPQRAESKELFEYIRNNTSEDAAIAFIKPRVLAYFTGRKSLGTWRGDSQRELAEQFDKFDVDYLLWFKLAGDENFEKFILQHPEELEKVFENRHFRLFRLVP